MPTKPLKQAFVWPNQCSWIFLVLILSCLPLLQEGTTARFLPLGSSIYSNCIHHVDRLVNRQFSEFLDLFGCC